MREHSLATMTRNACNAPSFKASSRLLRIRKRIARSGIVRCSTAGPRPSRLRKLSMQASRAFRWAATATLLSLALPAETGAEDAVAAPLAAESLLLDGAAAGSRLVVVGDRGHILISSDGGDSWTQARVPVRVLLTAVHMHDEQTGWAVGHDAVILRTGDGGETWSVAHRAPEEELPLLDVWFRDERSGYAIGAYGYFLATDDGGETWSARTISEDDFHLNALIPAEGTTLDPRRMYIAAEAGVAYKSVDGGESWQELPSPYGGSWFGGLAFEDNEVLLTGLKGNLFRSGDGGETWTRIDTGTRATLTGAIRLRSGQILVTGLDGTLLASLDGGRSFSTHRLPTRKGISAALPLDDRSVLLVGEFGIERFALDE